MRWELSPGPRDAGQHRHSGPGPAARAVRGTRECGRVRACVRWHGPVSACARAPSAGTALLHGLCVPAAAEAVSVSRKPAHRQSPPHRARGDSAAPPGGARGAAALCSPQPARPEPHPGQGRSSRAAAELAPHVTPSGPRAGPESSSSPSSTPPPPLHRTAQEEANTTSDDSTPQSTAQLCSPLQVVLRSRELIPGYPGPSRSGCP